YWPLLWSNLKRKKPRTIFTLFAVMSAFALFGLLAAMQHGMNGVLEIASAQRIQTNAKLGALPIAYAPKIESVPGVTTVAWLSGFDGYYQDEKNDMQVVAVSPAAFLKVYPEILLSPQAREAWFGDRTGAIVGTLLAKRYGWKVGDQVPIRSKDLTKDDGSNTWDLTIDGIYDADLPDRYKSFVMIHYPFFNDSIATGKDLVFQYIERISDPRAAPEISRAIDDKFANSFPQTRTESEVAETQTFLREFGNIGFMTLVIGAAVFFSMLLVTINTMSQAVRERTSELAVLKALGFGRGTVSGLVLAEAVGVTLIGGLLGLAAAWLLARAMYGSLSAVLPALGMPAEAVGLGVLLMILFGLIAGALPLRQVFRLRAADALRRA
ncbi:MAG TPA: ABC transporter permease, partial [Gammaproteobacteria bacterium]|nr:ABC transporter permease [Gammaproteobacteria bacterium]